MKWAKLRKKGRSVMPVALQGRMLTKTFWGNAWCSNLESYSDYANRLPRGQSYVRNGLVVDLQLRGGNVTALVSGSQLYKVRVKVLPIPKARWSAICKDCAGSIDSLVELLQGRLSKAVMERVCQQRTGLFPAPSEIKLSCSCPDWATMCKHVAAVLYGIGTRLDEQPELMFELRAVDERKLIAAAAKGRTLVTKPPVGAKVLDGDDLTALFGLEIEQAAKPTQAPEARKSGRARSPAKKKSTNKGRKPLRKG